MNIKKVSQSLQNNINFKNEALENIVNDYIKQNCVYLELRDTPRENLELNYYVYDYLLDLIEKTISLQNENKNKIIIRFFINLHKAPNMKEYNIKIFEAFKLLPDEYKNFILGVDIGGYDNNFDYFYENKNIYNYFKNLGYKINFHLYENPTENYFREIINFKPDRISQCVYLNNYEELDLLINSKIPLEILPSFSLKITNKIKMKEMENFCYLYKNKHSILIGTDNSYLLNTNLTNEYFKYYEFIKDMESDLTDENNNFKHLELLNNINHYKLAFNPLCQKDAEIINNIEVILGKNIK